MKQLSVIIVLSIIFLLTSCGEKKGPIDHNTANFSTGRLDPRDKIVAKGAIANIVENKWFWTEPDALLIENNGNCYVWEYFDASPVYKIEHFYGKQYLKYSMKIMRIGNKYKVDITHCKKHKWERNSYNDVRDFRLEGITGNVIEIIKK